MKDARISTTEYGELRGVINALQQLLLDLSVCAEAQLSTRQLTILLTCVWHPGNHTIRGLSRKINVPKAAVVRAVDRLEQSKLVKRVPDPSDRRSVLILVQPAGRERVYQLCRPFLGAATVAARSDEASEDGRLCRSETIRFGKISRGQKS